MTTTKLEINGTDFYDLRWYEKILAVIAIALLIFVVLAILIFIFLGVAAIFAGLIIILPIIFIIACLGALLGRKNGKKK